MVLTKVKKQAASQAASTLQPQHRLSRVGPTAPLDSFKTWLEKDTSDLVVTVLLQAGGWTRNAPDNPSNSLMNQL